MQRLIIAALALFAAACSPSAKVDSEDPFATLQPWNHEWSQVKTVAGCTEGAGKCVEYIVLKRGDASGARPSPADEVTVMYDGRLAADGKQFDSSYERGEPATFRLNQVIPGWTQGLQEMRPGDEFMFWIPAALGYGEEGAGGDIPPNADLMFRVELQKVIPAATSDEAAWAKASPWPTDSADVVRTASGLEYLIVSSGDRSAAPAGPRDFAIVHFRGRLDDGSEVASTFEEQQPQIFPIEQLVPGWSETLQMMRPGDRWMVRIPPHLMYGEEGDGRIPPNAAVTFEILINEVVRIPDPATPPPQPAEPPR
jgi:FKBP-type peptidyl-prolyl cis-trans isomerase